MAIEIKEQEELVIESKGKQVKKNVLPDNPVITLVKRSNWRL